MIYDCFHFNDEFDLLEIRLNHHSQFIDKFIIIQASKTYSGKNKKIYDSAIFKDKIYFINLDFPFEGNENWKYEHLQRNILKGFTFENEDIVIYSDCDEIIRDKSIIDNALNEYDWIADLQMDLYFYYFNLRLKERGNHESYHLNSVFQNKFHMAKIIRAGFISDFDNLYEIRQFHIENPVNLIPNAGWHFSNLGSPERIYNKLKAISHSDEPGFIDLTPDKVSENKAKLIDPLGRDGCVYEIVPDSELPEYIIQNKDRFSEYFRKE